jgi:diadenosine tetraphosphate (Ap4A) HIT family hydrolase
MLAGTECPMCDDAHLPVNVHGELIADLAGSYARLAYNQTKPGYSVVIAKRHSPELFDLTREELRLFWIDVADVASTIQQLFAPVKLDYLVMGHLCPHVHCHVYPQYASDDPHGLLDPKSGDVRLNTADWQERLAAVRHTLNCTRKA